MSEPFKIESGFAITPRKPRSQWTEAMKIMSVGQSFFTDKSSARSTCYNVAATLQMKGCFEVRTVVEGQKKGFRVFRVK